VPPFGFFWIARRVKRSRRTLRSQLSRRDFFEGIRDMVPPQIGLLPWGLVCGVGAQALGASVWEALALSVIIFSGSAQIVAMQLIGAGAPVVVIVLTSLAISLRFVVYSAALAPYLKPLSAGWRALFGYFLSDQAFAASIERFREREFRFGASYFLGCGVMLWIGWQLSSLAGYLLGNVLPASWSLDFTVPLCFLALLVPALTDRASRIAALAAGVSVIALDPLPLRLSLICAGMIGIVAGMIAERSGGAGE
jgi:predicted branched-subunit amino acid permease